jgi:hypothetical protein
MPGQLGNPGLETRHPAPAQDFECRYQDRLGSLQAQARRKASQRRRREFGEGRYRCHPLGRLSFA